MKYNEYFGANETLCKLKGLCDEYDVEDKNILKNVFEECESSMIYNIETDTISHGDEDEGEDEE